MPVWGWIAAAFVLLIIIPIKIKAYKKILSGKKTQDE